MTDLVVQQSMFDLSPAKKIAYATEVAGVLKDIIKKQKMSVKIGPNDHVKAEGWATLGTILGILPRERDVTESENGDFIAHVDLIRQSDGRVVGGASSLCGSDEKRWGGADRYARRSMAVTRATGKAYRLAFAWIVTLAGYSPTPAEEMPAPSDGFDPNNSKHIDALEDMLGKRGVPTDQWASIAAQLKGRPSSDIEGILTNGTR